MAPWGPPDGLIALRRHAWHSKHFGFDVLQIDHFLGDFTSRRELLKAALAEKPKDGEFNISCRVDIADLDGARALEEAGFRFAGSYVKLAQPSADMPYVFPAKGQPIRPFRDEDLPHLMRIASEGFRHSRFHSDPRFPIEKASSLFAEWIRKRSAGTDRGLFIAEENGAPVGFILTEVNPSISNAIGKRYGDLNFLVVDAASQGRGWGRKLINHSFLWFKEHTDYAEVRTMGDNLFAIRLYQRLGFRAVSHDIYFHYWGG